MANKNYNFDFYQCITANSDVNAEQRITGQLLDETFTRFEQGNSCVKEIASYTYELRLFERTEFGYRGVIGKHRTSDLPNAAIVGGEERELQLAPNENLLEKSFFHFYRDYSLLIVQRNHMCIGFNNLAKYFSSGGYVTALSPVLAPADLLLLMKNNIQIRHADFSIAKPTNPDLFEGIEHDFTNNIISTLSGSGTAMLNLTMRGNAKSDVADNRYLASSLKGAFRELNSKFDVKKCKLLLEDADTLVTHPIDLVADRLVYYARVNVEGRYPSAAAMWQAMEDARDSKESELELYFGSLERQRLG